MNQQLAKQWWLEVRWPALLFLSIAVPLAFTDADLFIAQALFYDAASGSWLGAHNWWVEGLLHTGGRWAIRIVIVSAILYWALGAYFQQLGHWRRPVGYFALASLLSVALVGLLKTLTNVDCPWDLIPFGGRFPVVSLFSDRPDALRAAQCFPAAHASSGYALIAFYYATRERSNGLARGGLAVGILCGVMFGLAQQSRGAHFMSHDVWSAFLVWSISAAVYVFVFASRLHASSDPARFAGERKHVGSARIGHDRERAPVF